VKLVNSFLLEALLFALRALFGVGFLLGQELCGGRFFGYALGMFSLIEFFNFLPRIWGQAAENLVLVAIPTFVVMGVMMERSGVANDMLYVCQVLLKKVPGGLAMAVAAIATTMCQPAPSASAHTASSKSRASAPSIVTNGKARKSVRSPRTGGFAALASAKASPENSTGMPWLWIASRLIALGASIGPRRSTMRARGKPYARPSIASARTSSFSTAFLWSPALTT